eukprot:207297-Chlamydomonas_euryale.AAC.1
MVPGFMTCAMSALGAGGWSATVLPAGGDADGHDAGTCCTNGRHSEWAASLLRGCCLAADVLRRGSRPLPGLYAHVCGDAHVCGAAHVCGDAH